MKLPKFIASRKFRSSSSSASPLASPQSPSPKSPRLASPKSLSSPFKAWPDRGKSPVQLSLPSPRSRSRRRFVSEITEESPKSILELKIAGCSSSSISISKSLFVELEQVFRQFDANGDGKISAPELGAVLRSLGDDTSDEEVTLMLNEVDSDGDGYIDLQEFIDLNLKALDTDGDIASLDELQAAFYIFDRDRNGYITADELHEVLMGLGDEKCTVDDCSKMIRGVDRNGDGLVDFEEFKIMMTSAC